jgi:hypothetical protein
VSFFVDLSIQLANPPFPDYTQAVRIHYLIAVISCVITVSLFWWNGVKGKDFLTPPSDQRLVDVRHSTAVDLKVPDVIAQDLPTKAILVKPTKLTLPDPALEPTPQEKEEELVELGDWSVSPGLDCYADLAEKGSDFLVAMATQLETKGELQRALLAWERVLDVVKPEPAQYELASKAILRLSPQLPLWNVDPSAVHVIQLKAGCDRETAELLEPILVELCAQLSTGTSGIVEIKAKVNSGPRPAKDAPKLPIALWFTGFDEKSTQSKTITIPSDQSDPAVLRNLVLTSAYRLIREDVGSHTAFQAPIAHKAPQDPMLLFQSSISRLLWQEFASRLNTPAP